MIVGFFESFSERELGRDFVAQRFYPWDSATRVADKQPVQRESAWSDGLAMVFIELFIVNSCNLRMGFAMVLIKGWICTVHIFDDKCQVFFLTLIAINFITLINSVVNIDVG